jgi:hypothetical protein
MSLCDVASPRATDPNTTRALTRNDVNTGRSPARILTTSSRLTPVPRAAALRLEQPRAGGDDRQALRLGVVSDQEAVLACREAEDGRIVKPVQRHGRCRLEVHSRDPSNQGGDDHLIDAWKRTMDQDAPRREAMSFW